MLKKNQFGKIWVSLFLFVLTILLIDNSTIIFAQTQRSRPTKAPIAYFTHSPFKIIKGEQIVFDARSSKGEIRYYYWDYDNNGSTDQITDFPFGTWVFKSIGLVKVRLRVVDKENRTAEAIYALMVYDETQRPGPLVNFSAQQESRSYNIIFKPQIIASQPAYYIWDFGDGIQSYIRAGEQVNHRYKESGIYRVFLRSCTIDNRCHETAKVINVKWQIEQHSGIVLIIAIIKFMVAFSCNIAPYGPLCF